MPRGVKAEPVETAEEQADKVEHRSETFEATRPDGTVVVIVRNIDTGEQTVTEKDSETVAETDSETVAETDSESSEDSE